MNNFQTVANQLNSNTNLYVSKVYRIKNDITDNYLSFILNFKQYENVQNAYFVYFEKILLYLV